MTTTPQEPGADQESSADPDVVPSGDPDPIHVDPVDPGTPTEPDETENPDQRGL